MKTGIHTAFCLSFPSDPCVCEVASLGPVVVINEESLSEAARRQLRLRAGEASVESMLGQIDGLAERFTGALAQEPEFPHYFRDVRHLKAIDVYRILDLFDVADHAIGHAIKKLLVAGGRGAKDVGDDVGEAIKTLQRWQAMQAEDAK